MLWLYLLIALAGLALIAYVMLHRILPYVILQPGNKVLDTTPARYGLRYEALRFEREEGIELDAFLVPAVGTPRANLIVLHGIGSCKEVYLPNIEQLVRKGYNVLAWDQRQHGKSGGEFCTYGVREREDVRYGLEWLGDRFPDLPTGIYGNSMGGAVAIQSLARFDGLRFGLIESTFTDLPAVTNAYGRRLSGLPLPRWLTDYVLHQCGAIAGFDPFAVRPVDDAARITQPILHIHGDADANIGIDHAHRLFAAYGSADAQLYVVPGGDHADLWAVGGDAYSTTWYGFLERDWRAMP